MFRKNLKKAFREIRNEKFTSVINILGLSIGIACFILTFIWVIDEISYDKGFKESENIYRINFELKLRDNEHYMASSPGSLANVIAEEIPEVEAATRVYQFADYALRYEEDNHIMRGVFINSDFFDVFPYHIIEGDPSHLSARSKIILTESAAKRITGSAKALGKFVHIPDQSSEPFEVVAVIKDQSKNSHIHFDILISQITHEWMTVEDWFESMPYTYVKLNKEAIPASVELKFPSLIKKYVEPQLSTFAQMTPKEFYAAGSKYNFHLQPIRDIHLKSQLENEIESGGNIMYVKLFSIVALFILLIACFNFINLSTANSFKQAKEAGIRKVLGALRGELARQFLLKSFLLSLISTLTALIISILLMPLFSNLTGKALSFSIFASPVLLGTLAIIIFFVGLASGSYPAFLLSSFKPVDVLKGKLKVNSKGTSLRDILVILQFAIAIIIILSTTVVYKQLQYIQKMNLGFDKEFVVTVTRGRAIPENRREAFKQVLLAHNNFSSVSFCQDPPGNSHFEWFFQLEGDGQNDLHQLSFMRCDHDYAQTLNMKIKEGRFFSPQYGTDSLAVVINEATVRQYGMTNPLEHRFIGWLENGDPIPWHIIGVVEDYNFESLKENIKPIIISSNVPHWAYFLMVKVKPGNMQASIEQLQTTWDEFTGGEPFHFTFLDDDLYGLYKAEILTRKIFSIFAILSVFIACLGLYSLAAHYAQQRTKEIGVRKVNGAKIAEILALLNKDFVKWVAIAFVIATPIAYYSMHKWLENFAYKTELSWWIFALAGLLTLGITLLTVSWQSWKAATRNPVEALRYE